MKIKQIIAAVLAVAAVICIAFAVSSSVSSTIPKDSIELLPTEFQTTAKRSSTVNMVAVGDNLIHTAIYQQALNRTGNGSYNFLPVYDDVKDLIGAADIAVINQETMMYSERAAASYPCFNTPVEMAQNLADIGFDVLTIANNHMLDVSSKGLISTLDLINSTDGLLASGAYHNREEYTAIKTITVNDITFAFLSFTEHTNGIPLPEDKDDYIVYLNELDDVKLQVEYAATVADCVVVSMHAGTEYADNYNSVQSEFAQKVADWGADLIIGTHPHTLQAVESLTAADGRQVPVMYSLGNFVSTQNERKRLVGGIANISITKDFSSGEITVGKPQLDIAITHYRAGRSGVKIYRLANYTDALASVHGVSGFSLDFIYEHIRNILGEEYLIEEYRSGFAS
ncbi:MAG: CapA family protein [Clostridia bacterium]|nr:CapA family protein [Clostridia bacterium]